MRARPYLFRVNDLPEYNCNVKFGVNSFIWSPGISDELLGRLEAMRERGIDGMEFPVLRPDQTPAVKIRRAVERNQLESTFCSVVPYGMSALSEDIAVRKKTLAHLADCIQVTAEAGASILGGPLYSPVGYLPGRRRTEDEWKRAVEFFQSLGPVLETSGVTLAIEALNRFETYFINTAADAVRLAAEVGHPNFGVLFDTFHANIEEKDIAGALRSAAPYLRQFHASENDRGTPGSGHVDWEGVFQAIRAIGYGGWVTIESFGFALGEISAAASIWRDLAPTVDEIAFAGVEFLRRGIAQERGVPA